MNTIFKTLSILLFAIWLFSTHTYAQFKGRIEYKITYLGSNVDLAELQQLPTQMTVVTKNNLVRTELSSESGDLFQIKISDYEKQETRTMIELLRQKFVITKTNDQIQTDLKNMSPYDIEYTGETREIMGFQCKKAIARTELGDSVAAFEIFYTEEIPGGPFNFDTPYYQIPGLMLQYEVRIGALQIQYTPENVKKRWWVRNKNFKVSDDYDPVTLEEMRQRF